MEQLVKDGIIEVVQSVLSEGIDVLSISEITEIEDSETLEKIQKGASKLLRVLSSKEVLQGLVSE